MRHAVPLRLSLQLFLSLSRWQLRSWPLLAWTLLGCQATSGAAISAVANTAVAATASGISRAGGGCYANCPTGTACNEKTGLCDELPCRGRCNFNEVCDEKALVPTCRPTQTPPLEIEGQK